LFRFSSTFPAGSFGGGLLAIRLGLAASAGLEGAARLLAIVRPPHDPPLLLGAAIGAIFLVCGGLVLAGLLTAPAATTITLIEAALIAHAAVVTGALTGDLADPATRCLRAAMAMGLALTGPGAYSMDARLFGRREIRL
jgi:uncharacterized membrane protein YphA (DoxX/SURF4 family)